MVSRTPRVGVCGEMMDKGEGEGEETGVAGPRKMKKGMMQQAGMDFDVLCVWRAKDYKGSGGKK